MIPDTERIPYRVEADSAEDAQDIARRRADNDGLRAVYVAPARLMAPATESNRALWLVVVVIS